MSFGRSGKRRGGVNVKRGGASASIDTSTDGLEAGKCGGVLYGQTVRGSDGGGGGGSGDGIGVNTSTDGLKAVTQGVRRYTNGNSQHSACAGTVNVGVGVKW
jgi:hypothetical protein